jgi:hypothetical protein
MNKKDKSQIIFQGVALVAFSYLTWISIESFIEFIIWLFK